MSQKAITIPTKELSHQKIILAGWYNFLKETFDSGKISSDEFTDFLRANVVYDMDKDQVDLILTGTQEVLDAFRTQLFGSK
ncbi:hypothetical protein [Leptospira sp. GIMC2001]|uniref:hypothetical protein n=1 Tax=Leptospira sp. GIMC2001 TaxID=1513297 RepID=UPI00234AB663|nr:hypothetical protein [Leptospira sp. GIMC2001]WCL50398.1 hypothetical protein O4O04_06150 [Leptospira sp. GIMC2001]